MMFLSARPYAAAVLALLFPVMAAGQTVGVSQTDRIGPHPEMKKSLLAGQTPAWVRQASDDGAVADGLPLRLTFTLSRSPERQAAFTKLLEDQQNPQSDRYHKWLTPEQAGEEYGPTLDDLESVTGWLKGQGFTISEVAPSRVFVTVDGSASVAGKALATNFRYFRVRGERRIAAATAPSIPEGFALVISAIGGLAGDRLEPMSHFSTRAMGRKEAAAAGEKPQYTNNSGVAYFITPADFATIFDVNPVYKAGVNGAGQKVAIIGRSRVVTTDIQEYESITGLPANLPNVVIPANGVDPGISRGDLGEATLDVDRVIGTAPGVQADLVVSGTAGNYDGIYVAAQYEVQHLLDPVMNISFGACEAYAGAGGVSLWDTLFAQAASEGISVFVSAADSGAATCDAQFSTPFAYQFPSINYICASSYATCVGATEPSDNGSTYGLYWSSTNGTGLESALGYIPEGAWNEPTVDNAVEDTTSYVAAATGGGASVFVPKPAWQTGVGVPADGARDVPDVSFPGAAHDAYFSCFASGGGDCANNRFAYFYGTSAAAPGYAGVTALLNQQSGGSQGNMNPLLYRTAASTRAAFHDATVASSGVTGCTADAPSLCNNSTPSPTGLQGGLAGFVLTDGYDQATGLGSLDVAKFLSAAAGPGSKLEAAEVAVSAADSSIADTQTDSFTATVTTTAAGTPSGTVQFYADLAPLGGAIPVTGGVATTGPLPFSSAGTFLIAAVYSGDSKFATATAAGTPVTVTGLASSTSIAASTTTPAYGDMTPFTATISQAAGSPAPTGLVRFNFSNVGNVAAPVKNGTATATVGFPAPGRYTVSARYYGDAVYSPSNAGSVNVTVPRIPTGTSVNNVPMTVGVGGTVGVTIDVQFLTYSSIAVTSPAPTGTVQLLENGVAVGSPVQLSATGAQAEAMSLPLSFAGAAPGAVVLSASYSGDGLWSPSVSDPVSISVVSTPPSYDLQASAASLTLNAGESNDGDVLTVTEDNGFVGTVNLACSVKYNGTGTAVSLPTCALSGTEVVLTAAARSEMTKITVLTTKAQAVKSASAMFKREPQKPAEWPLGTAAAALLLGAAGWRRRGLRRLAMLAVVAGGMGLGMSALGGCSGGGSSTPSAPPPSTPPPSTPGTTSGSYTVTITASTSGATAAPAPVTISLTVN